LKICVCVLIAMSLCFIPSCKKSEPSDEGSGQQSISATPPSTPAPSTPKPVTEEPEKLVEAVKETVAEAPAEVKEEAPAAPAADTAGLVPIDIKLPKAMKSRSSARSK